MQDNELSLERLDYTVLYVEDEEPIRERLYKTLNIKFKEVLIASDGDEAFDIFREKSPDLIITDICMPKVSGLELSRAVKELSPDTPIVITTAYNETNFFIEAIECGINNFILKPVELTMLFRTVEGICANLDVKRNLGRQENLLSEYKRAVDASNIVCKTDLNGIITYVNDEFCKVSGYDVDELIGVSESIVRHPNMSAEVFRDMWEKLQNKEVWKGIVENRAKDGHSYWVDMTIVPILDEYGQVSEYIGIKKDISAMILQERELENLRASQLKESVDKAIEIHLKEVIELSPLPTLIVNEGDILEDANQNFITLLDPFFDSAKIEAIESKKAKIDTIFEKEGLLAEDGYALDWKEMAKNLSDESDYIYLSTNSEKLAFKVKIKDVEEDGKKLNLVYLYK